MGTSDEEVMTKFTCLPNKFQLSLNTPIPPPKPLLGKDMKT